MSLIHGYVEKSDLKIFSRNIGTQDKILRRLSIIGEAARVLSAYFKNKHANIEWEKISGMRNVIVHEYFGVKLERIWQVAKHDLPKLRKEVEKMLKEIEKQEK